MRPTYKYLSVIAALVTAALLLVACGGSDGSSTGGETTAAGGSTESQSGESGEAAAKEMIAPYVGQPSPFPVTEKLKEVPKGATVVYADCGTPTCGLFWQLLEPAAKTMGVKLTRVKAGTSANTVSSAFESIVQMHPDAVIVVAINLELWSKQLKELQEAGTPVVTSGITGTEEYGLGAQQGGDNFAELTGKLMASYVTAEIGSEENVAFYGVPELPFSPLLESAFNAELKDNCPDCTVRTVDIAVTAIGNTAPNAIVSDLQANPDTTVTVFSTDEIEAGLPAALQAAGISVDTLGSGPGPTQLQYLKEGKSGAALGYDLAVGAWTLLDKAARESVGQEVTGLEAEGIGVQQFLTQADITFDPSLGWSGYPDFPERFAKLWGVGG